MSDYESDNGAVMHWFGQQDLGIKFGICLGILIILVVLLGCCKLIYNKHNLKKHTKAAETNKSEAKEELHVLNRREEEEGDLFGIRALEKGFYGGVAQSRPATPISTQSTLVPPRSVHDPSRPSSDTGYLKNSHAPGSGKDAVDMHLVVPPSPTFPRRNETRSPSPDGSSSSQGNAPQLEMPAIPSSGLSIQTYSTRPTSPRTQTSQFSSAGGHFDRGVPTVTISQSDSDRPQAPGSSHHEYNNTSRATSGNDNESDMKNRASTASFAELYDSYYHNRMSTMREQPDEREIYPSFISR